MSCIYIEIIYWFGFGIINMAWSGFIPSPYTCIFSVSHHQLLRSGVFGMALSRASQKSFTFILRACKSQSWSAVIQKKRFRTATNLLHDIMSSVSSTLPICVAATHCRKPSKQGHWCNTRRSLRARVKRQLHQNETYETALTRTRDLLNVIRGLPTLQWRPELHSGGCETPVMVIVILASASPLILIHKDRTLQQRESATLE